MGSLTAITTAEPAMLGFLQRAISDENFDVNKFEVVLAAVREEQAKHAEREFFRAMAAAQSEMEPIRKDAVNPHFKSRYATFEAIDSQIRPIYTKHGLHVSYRTGAPSHPGAIRVIGTVAHEAGHSIQAELEAALDNAGGRGTSSVQATGSIVSYLRRYILNMVFNVALSSEDDDGEATRATYQQQRRDAPPQQSQPDRFRKVADRIKQKLAEAQDQDAYNAVMQHTGIQAEWAKLQADRPELAEEVETFRAETLARIHAAGAQAEAEDNEIPELDA